MYTVTSKGVVWRAISWYNVLYCKYILYSPCVTSFNLIICYIALYTKCVKLDGTFRSVCVRTAEVTPHFGSGQVMKTEEPLKQFLENIGLSKSFSSEMNNPLKFSGWRTSWTKGGLEKTSIQLLQIVFYLKVLTMNKGPHDNHVVLFFVSVILLLLDT